MLTPETLLNKSPTLLSLLFCARSVGEKSEIEQELVVLRDILRALWNAMSAEGRILYHRSEAVTFSAFDGEVDPIERPHLKSADDYYRLIRESRASREFGACSPDWVAGDMEQMISAAWDCLGASEKGKALASPEIEKLISSYRATRLC